MKSNTKKWLCCALTFLLALPAFADDAAQKQLEQEVLTLLKQGNGTQIKTLLEEIPQCPENNAQLYQKEIPARCTHDKFNSDAPNLDEYGRDVPVQIESVRDPGFTKAGTIVAVHPTNALVAAMDQYYTHLYGDDIKTYNQASYVKFFNHFQDLWLKEMARSVLMVKIWTGIDIKRSGVYCEHTSFLRSSKELGGFLYRDLNLQMKLGMSFQQALRAESKIISIGTRGRKYLYDIGRFFYPFDGVWKIFKPGEIENLYDGFREEAVKDNNVALFNKYRQHIYYSIFTTDDLEDPAEVKKYRFFLLTQFGSEDIGVTQFTVTQFKVLWDFVTTPMPENLKEQMRASIGKHIKFICTHPDALEEVMGFSFDSDKPEERNGLIWCKNFKTQAIKHDLWPMSAAEKQALQREIQSQIRNNMLDALQKSF